MNILIAIETLQPGGAEWFVLRLADALQKQGHRVAVWVIRPDLVDRRLSSRFSDIQICGIPPGQARWLARLDRLTGRLGGKPNWVQGVNARRMRSFIRKFRPDAIHSHLMKTDRVAVAARGGSSIPIVITVHGDYINFYNRIPPAEQAAYKRNAQFLLKEVDGIVVISRKQEQFFRETLEVQPRKLFRIYNGYPEPPELPALSPDKRLTFGMVARGIPEKGWEIAINAFAAAGLPDAQLLLVGESQYLDGLKTANRHANVLFLPFTTEPLQAIARFDIGLLPSWYASESLPTTIIEYLALGKPVIASNAGEIVDMIQTPEGPAGITVPLGDQPAEMTEGVCQAMQVLAADHALRAAMSTRALKAFEAFRMDRCTAAYLKLYQLSRS